MSAEEEENNCDKTGNENNIDDDNISIAGDNTEKKRYDPPYDHLISNYDFRNKFLIIEKREKKGVPQKSFMKINNIGDVSTKMNKVRHVIWYSVNADINEKLYTYNFKYGDKASEFVDKLFDLFVAQENGE